MWNMCMRRWDSMSHGIYACVNETQWTVKILLTLCGLVVPHGDIHFGQLCLEMAWHRPTTSHHINQCLFLLSGVSCQPRRHWWYHRSSYDNLRCHQKRQGWQYDSYGFITYEATHQMHSVQKATFVIAIVPRKELGPGLLNNIHVKSMLVKINIS